MSQIDKKHLIRTFLRRASIFGLLWFALFYGYIRPSGHINNYLTLAVANGTSSLASLFGIDAHVTNHKSKRTTQETIAMIHFDQKPAAAVGSACNGLELFALFVGFIVCFPGAIWPKVLFSVLGTGFLFSINILRELALSFNFLYFRSSLEFNHKYTYAIAVYVIVFLIWRYWLNNYSILARNQ